MKQLNNSVQIGARQPEGPLAPYFDLFAGLLQEQGYSQPYRARQIRLVVDFSRWLKKEQLDVQALTSEHVSCFLLYLAKRVHLRAGDACAFQRLLQLLCQQGVIANTSPSRQATPIEQITTAYTRYQRQQRNLAEATLVVYLPFIRGFLIERFGQDPIDFSSLCSADMVGFIRRLAARVIPKRAKSATSALRSFLTYLRYLGEIHIDLAAAVPTVPIWSMTGIPRAIAENDAHAALAHCQRDTPVGCRDYAILLLLARLGLRAGEIVSLTLDSIDWVAGSLTVTGKRGHAEPLPLPCDVGEAIANYLQQGRPKSSHRTLFLRPSVPTCTGLSDAAPGGHSDRNRSITATSQSANDCNLCQSRFGISAYPESALAGRCNMNALQQSLQDYLALRRGLGFKLREAGQRLKDFVSFMDARRAEFITTALALAWAQQPTSADPSWWAQRLGYVRGLARYCSAIDARTEVPPTALLPFHGKRAKPYFYTDEDVGHLLQAALAQPSEYGLQGWTYYCLLGLIAVTGLRIGEALALTVDDVDLVEGLLTIRAAKFGKSRLVPLHASTQCVLAKYMEHRQHFLAGHAANTLFVNLRGNHLDAGQVHRVFYRLSRQVGLRAQMASHGPRLHDFRHRFALLTLLQWYRDGQDVERRLPVLSAYLGHVHPSDTYWYLSATAELLGGAKARLEDYLEQPS